MVRGSFDDYLLSENLFMALLQRGYNYDGGNKVNMFRPSGQRFEYFLAGQNSRHSAPFKSISIMIQLYQYSVGTYLKLLTGYTDVGKFEIICQC